MNHNQPQQIGSHGGLGKGTIDTHHIKTKFLELAYATDSPTQKLDLYLPNDGDGPFPLVIAIHGGAFKMGSKTSRELTSIFTALDHGYAVASVDYRLSPEAVFPAAVNDVKAAVRFLRAHAQAYTLDDERFIAWGGSAGGNLAAMLGTSAQIPELDGEIESFRSYSSHVAAVINWFGPLDFLAMDEQFQHAQLTPKFGPTNGSTSPESLYLGQKITLDALLTAKANPATYLSSLTPTNSPFWLIQHGSDDAHVPFAQSLVFSQQLAATIGAEKVSFIPLYKATHGSFEFDEPTNLTMIFNWLETVLNH